MRKSSSESVFDFRIVPTIASCRPCGSHYLTLTPLTMTPSPATSDGSKRGKGLKPSGLVDRPGLSCSIRRLEAVFQRELDHPRIDAGRRDLPEGPRPHVGKGICSSRAVVRIRELRMVEGVEEFSAELDRMILPDPDPFQNSDVPVELAGAENNTRPRIAVVRSVSDNGRRAKRAFVEIARAATCATQPLLDSTGCGDVRVRHPRAHLGPAESAEGAACGAVDRPGAGISDRHGSTVLHHGNSG